MGTFQEKFNDFFSKYTSSQIIAKITASFALIYHIGCLLTFHAMNIKPMFYMNIFSVSLFFSLYLALTTRNINDYKIAYLLSYMEVVIHQILAEYYLGAETAFHYFILLMGFIAYLLLRNHFGMATFFGLLSTIIYTVLEILTDQYPPVFQIAPNYLLIIRSINISLGIFLILILVIIFVAMAMQSEHFLENQVTEKNEEVNLQITKVSNLQNHIIISLASLVENRDSDTGEHIQRTSAYVEMIARKALENGIYSDIINEEFINVLKRAAPMHDVGKIVVPDHILKKPGKLTPEEFEEIKRHTTEGGRIINEVVGASEDKFYLKTAGEVALCHHEKWDGSGYPNHLKAQEIPVSARIMAIADVFDALVSPRCYKEPFPRETAYQIIQEGKGFHFDPILADLFLDGKSQIDEILIKYTK